MKSENVNLKVSFYLKKNISRKGLCPVMGRITVEKEDMVQFSCKLEADPLLWDVRAGRIIATIVNNSLQTKSINYYLL